MDRKPRKIIVRAAVLWAAAGMLAPAGVPQGTKAEEPPATTHLMAYVQAFNSGKPEEMR